LILFLLNLVFVYAFRLIKEVPMYTNALRKVVLSWVN